MLHAFKLYTGSDNHSHVLEGSVREDIISDAISICFKENPAHSERDWHVAPIRQYVLSLSGTLLFTTHEGKTFILKPGDVLIAEDTVGSGHRWKIIDGEPWRRAYIVLREGAADAFVAKASINAD